MCGVAGFAGRQRPDTAEHVRAQVQMLAHRGPDAAAVTQLQGCTLGHSRLRVIDLSPAADQPMRLPDARVSVVFNGEIYNFQELRGRLRSSGHRFRTATDTEVILHLYEEVGLDFVDRLAGMFAFALWDERSKRLVLARDRLGIKPLYYRLTQDGIAFASEARCLVTPRSSLRSSALAGYLRLGWVSGPETIYSDVYELLPGRSLVWQDGHSSVIRYASASAEADPQQADEEELAEALRFAVQRQLVADVPLGVFLSSGVDSVVLARLAAEFAPALRTYTVAFDTGPDESQAAAAIARTLGLDHAVVPVTGSEVLSALDHIVARMDQPTVDGFNSWVISRAVREAGLTVALSGLGGDELFRGYSTFRFTPRIAAVGRVIQGVPGPIGTAAVHALARIPRFTHSRGLRAVEAALHGGERAAYAAVRGVFAGHELERLWPEIGAVVEPNEAALTYGDLPVGLCPVTRLEVGNYLPFQLLRDTDAMSMAHALEVRVPLLDEEVMRVVWRRQHSGQQPFDKAALLRAVDVRLLPLAYQSKRTFTLPFGAWMRGPLRDVVQESLQSLAAADLGFDRQALPAMWHSFEEGRLGWRPVWALTALGLWLSTESTRHLTEVAA